MNMLEEALTLVTGSRQEEYGDKTKSFRQIAGLWSAYLDKFIDEYDVAKMMILLKVSRASLSNHRDSYVDIAGYVACIDIMQQQLNSPQSPLSD